MLVFFNTGHTVTLSRYILINFEIVVIYDYFKCSKDKTNIIIFSFRRMNI